MPTSNEIRFISRPKGAPDASNFEQVRSEVAEPGAGELLIKNLYMSVDPYMRGVMRLAALGEIMAGGAVGKVVASNHGDFAEGDIVLNHSGWREFFVSKGDGLSKIDPDLAPLSAFLGVLGMPGLTAYGGLLITGKLQDKESVFVSAASGAVGSLVGQIAKIKGCTVIGSAGSDHKVKQLTDKYGFDHGFNYKTADPLTELRSGAPDGIDVYFENVGGKQLEAALTHMRAGGRIPVCGMIAHYNNHGTPAPGPVNLIEVIYKHIMLKGFIVTEFEASRGQFMTDMAGWIKSGQVKYSETIRQGIGNAPTAFIDLFSGANNGKMLVQLAAT